MMEAFPQVAGLQSPPHYCSVVDERLSILENWIRLTAWCVKNGFLGKKS
jgi:adenosylcobinamide hydrolase